MSFPFFPIVNVPSASSGLTPQQSVGPGEIQETGHRSRFPNGSGNDVGHNLGQSAINHSTSISVNMMGTSQEEQGQAGPGQHLTQHLTPRNSSEPNAPGLNTPGLNAPGSDPSGFKSPGSTASTPNSPRRSAEAEPEHLADILIVDDTPANLRLLAALLSSRGYRVRKAISGKMAQLALETLIPDLILLDVRMPEMDGYSLCRLLKSNPETAGIPVIFLSALGEALDKVQAFEAGGVDYITKPFEAEEVLIRIRTHLSLQQARQEIQALNAVLEERVQERTRQLEMANLRLSELAHFDSLTGLPNRNRFIEILGQVQQNLPIGPAHDCPAPSTSAAASSATSPSARVMPAPPADPPTPADSTPDPTSFAVFFLDCDRFKLINDSLGHIAGDEVLVAVSQRLQETLRPEDVLARLGGDEFAVLVPAIQTVAEASELANHLIAAMSQPFWVHNHEIFLGVSIGIVMGHDRQDAPNNILRDADTAMYAAKRRGKGCYHLFSATMHKHALQRLQRESELRRALDQQELRLFYQPIVNLVNFQITGFEALIRWEHPQEGLVTPNQFIPLAEDMGLINLIGWWVLEEGCRQLQNWWSQGLGQHLTLNLNFSAYQMQDSHLLEHVDKAMQRSSLPPSALKLEITETAFIENDRTIEALQALKTRGFQLALDDFGTGYSSLSYLHSLPIDILKVDKSFVQQITDQSSERSLVTAILGIAQTLNLAVVAEGIETPHQLATLQGLQCDLGQGYLFSPPLPATEAEALLRRSVPIYGNG
ncbi:MAG: EAL domain-containing response regulator [Prochlorothrix sp.]